jgi:hypothetical protein
VESWENTHGQGWWVRVAEMANREGHPPKSHPKSETRML